MPVKDIRTAIEFMQHVNTSMEIDDFPKIKMMKYLKGILVTPRHRFNTETANQLVAVMSIKISDQYIDDADGLEAIYELCNELATMIGDLRDYVNCNFNGNFHILKNMVADIEIAF